MDKCILLIINLLMAISIIRAQNIANDVFVMNPGHGDQNLGQADIKYKGNPDALYLSESDQTPIGTITHYLAERPCILPHLTVLSTEESLVPGNLSLISGNINELSSIFRSWNTNISCKIMILSLSLAEKSTKPRRGYKTRISDQITC